MILTIKSKKSFRVDTTRLLYFDLFPYLQKLIINIERNKNNCLLILKSKQLEVIFDFI